MCGKIDEYFAQIYILNDTVKYTFEFINHEINTMCIFS